MLRPPKRSFGRRKKNSVTAKTSSRFDDLVLMDLTVGKRQYKIAFFIFVNRSDLEEI